MNFSFVVFTIYINLPKNILSQIYGFIALSIMILPQPHKKRTIAFVTGYNAIFWTITQKNMFFLGYSPENSKKIQCDSHFITKLLVVGGGYMMNCATDWLSKVLKRGLINIS